MKTVNKAKEEFIEEYDDIEASWGFSKKTEKDALISITPFEKDLTELLNLQRQETHEMYENQNHERITWMFVGLAFGFGIIVGLALMNLIF